MTRERYRNEGQYPKEEISLWCGVIRNAIIEVRRDCSRYQNKYQGSRYQAWQVDAHHWLFRSSYSGPGSLLWICEHLGLDPNKVRQKAMTCSLADIAAYQRQQEARG